MTTPSSSVPGLNVPGLKFGRYELQGQLSVAAPWVVWSARDVETGRRVTLRIADTSELSPDTVETLRAEAVRLTQLRHPNVVFVKACGLEGNELYRAEDVVRGLSLDRWPRERRRTWREVCRAYLQAGSGLLALHSAGLSAQPFTPSGVIVTPDDRIVLTDLRSTLQAEDYQAPEELEGRRRDARSDQFSFAVALVEALTGLYPFELRPTLNQGRASFQGTQATKRLPGGLAGVLDRALALDPNERYPSMRELLAALAGPVESSGHAARMWWATAAAAFLSLNVGMVAGAIISSGSPFTSISDVQERSCRLDLARFEGVWDPATQENLHLGLWRTAEPGISESWSVVRDTVTRWTEDWAIVYTRLCASSAVSPREALTLESKVGCLHAERQALATFTSVLPSLGARRAVASLSGLPSPLSCGKADLNALRWFEQVSQGRAHTSTVSTEQMRTPGPLETRGFAAWAESDFELAARSFRRAAELREQSGEAVQQTQALLNLGLVLQQLGAPDEAELQLRRALQLVDALDRPRDELRSHVLHNLGLLLAIRGHWQEALVMLRQAMSLRERVVGVEGPEVADTLRAIGWVELQSQRGDDATASYRRALTLRQRTFGEAAPQVAITQLELARALLTLGKTGEAQLNVEQAEAIGSRSVGRTSRLGAAAIQVRAAVNLELGNAAEALEDLNEAGRIYEARGADPWVLAEHAFLGARVSWALPDQRSRAHALARSAQDRLAGLGPDADILRRAVDAWIADHPEAP